MGVLVKDLNQSTAMVAVGYRPIVKINNNQKFGYSKDTPFTNSFVEYNQSTKAILTQPARYQKNS